MATSNETENLFIVYLDPSHGDDPNGRASRI